MLGDSTGFSGFSVDDVEAAHSFYGDTLGLEVEEENGALTIRLPGAANVFVYPKEDHEPASFTILNFSVSDIDAKVREMNDVGIEFLRYDGLDQDEQGIARGDMGPAIAWFTGPAGNIVSVLQD